MGLLNFFSKSPDKLFLAAQDTVRKSHQAFRKANNRDVERLRMGMPSRGESEALRIKFKKKINQYLNTAIQLDPTFAPALFAKGEIALGEGNLDEAISCLEKALESDPGLADAHYCLGKALERKKIYEKSLFHFGKALEINLNDAEALMGKACILLRDGREQEGRECSNKAKALDPSFTKTMRVKMNRWPSLKI